MAGPPPSRLRASLGAAIKPDGGENPALSWLDPADRSVVAAIDHVVRAGLAVDEEQRIGVAKVEHHHRVGHAAARNIDARFGDDRGRVARILFATGVEHGVARIVLDLVDRRDSAATPLL